MRRSLSLMPRSGKLWWRATLAAASATVACSWQRFDDVATDTPVVILERPAEVPNGFGNSVTVLSLGEDVEAMISGRPGESVGARFRLGKNEAPSTNPSDTSACRTGAGDGVVCSLSPQPAALPRSWAAYDGVNELCFVLGPGEVLGTPGLVTRCKDNVAHVRPVPNDVEEAITTPAGPGMRPAPVFLAASRENSPLLAAGAPEQREVWFYRPLEGTPNVLRPAGKPGKSFGRTLAVAKLGTDAHLIAVGAPEANQVWLFRVEADEEAEVLGCLGGPRGWGRSLAAGYIDPDDSIEDLVVADESFVTVLDGDTLASLPALPAGATAECSLASLPEGALVASFSCGSERDISGCQVSRFGASLAVADLDGDGDGEVAVGAPDMTVRDKARGGAVLIYDVEPDDPNDLSDVRIVAEGDEGDRLGEVLSPVPQKDRDVLLAGMPGKEAAAILYCSALVTGDSSSRCR